MLNLKGWRTHPQAVPIQQATQGSACWDVSACLISDQKVNVITSWNESIARSIQEGRLTLFSGERALIPSGWIFDIPHTHSMRLHPRSGLAWKQGISLANAEGVIDADYIQETFVCVLNMTDVSHVIKHGDRIAQLELVPVWDLRFEEVDVAPSQKTDRQGGFGSTGVHT